MGGSGGMAWITDAVAIGNYPEAQDAAPPAAGGHRLRPVAGPHAARTQPGRAGAAGGGGGAAGGRAGQRPRLFHRAVDALEGLVAAWLMRSRGLGADEA